jgi:succinyl-diaminopimelate desuccinylase
MTGIFHNHFTLTGPLMKDLLELTKELMRFKSMHSRPDEIKKCVDFIERFLKDAGATCRRI